LKFCTVVFAGLWFLTQMLQGTVDLLTPASGGGVPRRLV
jgi:hypothetical protein